MYLVHIHLGPHPAGRPLPDLAADVLQFCATDADRLELTCVHPDALPHPVIALFLIAESLATAEATAHDLWRRTVIAYPHLSAWAVRSAQVPLMPEDLW